MNWFKNLFVKKKETLPEEPKIKEFEFSLLEAACIGDKYIYKIKAESEEEAFKILVKYFYTHDYICQDVLKSKVYQVSYPGLSKFIVQGMPRWFARLISGGSRSTFDKDLLELKEYCIKNGITLKKD